MGQVDRSQEEEKLCVCVWTAEGVGWGGREVGTEWRVQDLRRRTGPPPPSLPEEVSLKPYFSLLAQGVGPSDVHLLPHSHPSWAHLAALV